VPAKKLTSMQSARMMTDLANGMSIRAAARKYEISPTTVGRYKNGIIAWEPAELQPCGTPAAYRRHKRKREMPCSDCLAAWVTYNKRYQPKPKLRPHGTEAGWQRHRRRKEKPCESCRKARNRANRRRYRLRKRIIERQIAA
jgi:hypothetical protein